MGLNLLGGFLNESHEERIKYGFLSAAFFFLIAGYTVAKELENSVFMTIVGRTYVPLAKTITLFALIPAIFLYSKLVDRLRRYQLLMFYTALFGSVGLYFSYLLGHPTIGLANTQANPNRLFGWIFYFFVEGYTPFLVSVFWAFANSISSPESAKRNYGMMVSASKVGGMMSAALAWYLFSQNIMCASGSCQDVWVHQVVMAFSSSMLMVVPLLIWLLKRNVPGRYLHGYEAVYKAEKERKKVQSKEKGSVQGFFKSIFSGLILLVRYPYVMGIFGMVYFYEVGSTVLNYLRLGVAQAHSTNVSELSANLLQMMFLMHLVGFFISLFGTSNLLQKLGERTCLLLIPLLSGSLLLYLMVETTPFALMCAWVAFKAVNYAFSWPVRESLYIPTVKEIKFKAKSWIDAFGSKFAKSSGSAFNYFGTFVGSEYMMSIHSFFFAGIITFWFIDALLLGNRFDRAVENNEVIGLDENSD